MSDNLMAIDLEWQVKPNQYGATTSVKNDLLLVACALGNGNEHVWDYRKDTIPEWFFRMLRDDSVKKIIHNVSADSQYILKYWGIHLKNTWCSLMNERLLYLGDKTIKSGLKDVLFRRFGVELDKSIRDNLANGFVSEREREYTLRDVRYLIPLYEAQLRDIEKSHLSNASRIENEVAPVLGEISYNGMPFELSRYNSLIDRAVQLKITVEESIYKLLNRRVIKNRVTGAISGGINLNSTTALLKMLNAEGVSVENTKSNTLVSYLYSEQSKQKRALVLLILQHRKFSKALTWGYEKKVFDGFIYPEINSLGAETSRMASSNPNGQQVTNELYYLDDKMNMIPSGVNLREPFRAMEGYSWVGADYSQIELRTYGDLANVKAIIDEYQKDEPDLHLQAASILFNKNREDITKHERNAGKPVNFGVRAFGGGPQALINTALKYGLFYSWEEAEQLIAKVNKADPEGIVWGKRVYEEAQRTGCIYTRSGYRRNFPFIAEIKPTVCRNTPVQGLAASMQKLALIKFADWVHNRDERIKLALPVHDELNTLAPSDIANEVLEEKKNIMLATGNLYLDKVPCGVSGYIAEGWSK